MGRSLRSMSRFTASYPLLSNKVDSKVSNWILRSHGLLESKEVGAPHMQLQRSEVFPLLSMTQTIPPSTAYFTALLHLDLMCMLSVITLAFILFIKNFTFLSCKGFHTQYLLKLKPFFQLFIQLLFFFFFSSGLTYTLVSQGISSSLPSSGAPEYPTTYIFLFILMRYHY